MHKGEAGRLRRACAVPDSDDAAAELWELVVVGRKPTRGSFNDQFQKSASAPSTGARPKDFNLDAVADEPHGLHAPVRSSGLFDRGVKIHSHSNGVTSGTEVERTVWRIIIAPPRPFRTQREIQCALNFLARWNDDPRGLFLHAAAIVPPAC